MAQAALRKNRFRVAEYFAGIGLVRLALERHGFEVVFANDIDPNKQQIYADNFAADDFCLGDVHEIAATSIPDHDVATASFPCNDLSIAGAMRGLDGDHSGAFWGFIRILRDLNDRRPKVVLLENVPGFLMSHKGADLEAALLALNELGYMCDVFMIDAARFVPQSRLRLFVVGRLGSTPRETFGLQPSAVRTDAIVRFIHEHQDIAWSIQDLPKLPRRKSTLTDIVEDLPDGDPAWWNPDRSKYFMDQLSERHMVVANEMINGAEPTYGTAFRRVRHGRSMAELRTDGIAGCLRTPRGGSGRQILFKAGNGKYQVRLLTARECARLQGVPDGYRINVPLNKALFGFGDAVCVSVIEWIAEHYLKPLFNGPAVGCDAMVRS